MGGLNFGRFFRIKTTKLCTHKAPKKRNKFYITSPKLTIFLENLPKNGKKSRIFRAPPCKMLQFWKFAPEAQENFAIFSLKYGQEAIQNGSRGPMGVGLAPLIPPRSATELPYLTRLPQCKQICSCRFISQKTGSFTTKSKNSIWSLQQ